MKGCPDCGVSFMHFDGAELWFCETKEMATVKITLHEDSSVSEETPRVPTDIDGNSEPGLTLVLRLSCGTCHKPQVQEIELWSPYFLGGDS